MPKPSDVDSILDKYSPKGGSDVDSILDKYSAPSEDPGVLERGGKGEEIEAGLRGGLKTATLGLSKPVIAGANAIIGNLIESGFEADDIKDFLGKAVDRQRLKKGYDEDIARDDRLQEESPVASAVGEIAGVVSPVGPASMLAKAGTKAGAALIKPIVSRMAGSGAIGKGLAAGGKLATGAAEGAGATVLPEAAQSGVELATGEGLSEDDPSLLETGETGAEIGAGLSMLPGVGRAVKAGAGKVGRGILTVAGGVKPKTIQEYIKHQPDAVRAMSEADLMEAATNAVESIKANLQTQRSALSDDIVDAVTALKSKVTSGSSRAMDLLDSVKGVSIGREKVVAPLLLARKGLLVGGKSPGTEQARLALQKIDDQIALARDLPHTLTPAAAKKQIMQFDDAVRDISRDAAAFPSKFQEAILDTRKRLDTVLKDAIPAYRKAMEPVAKDAEVLNELAAKFGDPKGAFSLIDQFGTTSGTPLMEDLKRLVEKTGKTGIMQRLQDVQKLRGIERLTPQTVEPFMRSVMNEKSLHSRKTLRLMSQLTGQDLNKMAKMTKLKGEFDKPFNAGSANVNLWAIALGGLGGITGGALAGTEGATVGSIIGAMSRVYGPSTTRKILDGVAKIQGMPTLKKLDSALKGITPEQRDAIKLGLTRFTTQLESEDFEADTGRKAFLKMEIGDASKLTPDERAEALERLQKEGKVSGKVLRAIAIGD